MFCEVQGNPKYSMSDFDAECVRAHLASLIDRSDIGLQTADGEDALSFLANNIKVDENSYTEWVVISKLIAKAGVRIDTRDESGCTLFLRWCDSYATSRVLAQLIEAGCDIEASDPQGNTGVHLLVLTDNYRALESLATSHRLLERFWCIKNRQGQTPLDLTARAMYTGAYNQQTTLIHRMLTVAQEEWKAGMVPLVLTQVTRALGVSELARLIIEYLDGSGKEFKPAQMHSGSDER